MHTFTLSLETQVFSRWIFHWYLFISNIIECCDRNMVKISQAPSQYPDSLEPCIATKTVSFTQMVSKVQGTNFRFIFLIFDSTPFDIFEHCLLVQKLKEKTKELLTVASKKRRWREWQRAKTQGLARHRSAPNMGSPGTGSWHRWHCMQAKTPGKPQQSFR